MNELDLYRQRFDEALRRVESGDDLNKNEERLREYSEEYEQLINEVLRRRAFAARLRRMQERRWLTQTAQRLLESDQFQHVAQRLSEYGGCVVDLGDPAERQAVLAAAASAEAEDDRPALAAEDLESSLGALFVVEWTLLHGSEGEDAQNSVAREVAEIASGVWARRHNKDVRKLKAEDWKEIAAELHPEEFCALLLAHRLREALFHMTGTKEFVRTQLEFGMLPWLKDIPKI